jgi:hypothetical protein
MGTNWSITDVVTKLEAQAAFHREREAFHAEHEESHRRERSLHAAELEQISARLEAFRAAATGALDLAGRSTVAPAEERQEDFGPASRPKLGRMVVQMIEAKGTSERFGAKGLTQQVNRRFGPGLRRPLDEGQVSVVLRRLERTGRIQLVRRGRPRHEALYARELEPAPQG